MPKRRARNHPAADVLAGVDQNRVFPRFPLTDEQWRETAKLSGIPEEADDARHHIETTIGIFRESQATDLGQVTSAEIRKELEALAARAQDLYDRLSKLVEVQDAYTALTGGLDGQRRLSQVLDVLLTLPKWLLVAKYRGVEAKKRGPKAQNVYWLVGNLDGIREHFTEKKITRSYKDDAPKKYITYVCRIADPDIGDGTIEKAMQDRIKRRDRIMRSVD
jgi:hypothetical protein